MSFFWPSYFWLFTALTVGTTLGRGILYFAKPGSVSLYEIAESVPGLACTVALYGFVYGVALGSKTLWLGLAVVLPAAFVVSMLSPKVRKLKVRVAIAVFMLTLLLISPAYVALILYMPRVS